MPFLPKTTPPCSYVHITSFDEGRREGWTSSSSTCRIGPELGKVTLKINGDEALSDKSVKKSNGDKALNG